MGIGALVRSFLKVGLVGFGGGSALIPVVEKEVVAQTGLLPPETFEEHVIVANLTPGALPVKLGAAAGGTLLGPAAALAGAFAVALPGVLGTVLLLTALSGFAGEAALYLEMAAAGILVFIGLILTHYIQGVQKNARRDGFGGVALAVTLTAFTLTAGKEMYALARLLLPFTVNILPNKPIFDLSAIHVLLLAIFIIVITSIRPNRTDGAATKSSPQHNGFAAKPMLITLALFLGIPLVLGAVCVFAGAADAGFYGKAALSAVTSFGGGEAYVAVAEGSFVGEGLGFITREALYTRLLPIANALPGPILVKLLAGIGYDVGYTAGGLGMALLSAAACMCIGIGATCAVFVPVHAAYRRFSGLSVFTRLRRFILPVVCGLLLTTMLSMAESILHTAQASGLSPYAGLAMMAVLAIAGHLLAKKARLPDVLCVLLLGGLSLGFLLAARII